ncbi:heterokaryon incompatibility protein-domain-containing protein [Paraphoma chrysanthemicola]|uniref:Heterokaryon incompatibility protein-domain-containing protein n=1 Tax=Paraphoma chrysanthemicola TaxID=798071 RepID=A0A8K0VV48_9PLEO|nr:heterokaryon incompatibility protein-domain-containing protein [Paraphoma chrysanthemicola]
MSTFVGSNHAIEFEGELMPQKRPALDDTGFGMPSTCSADEESNDGSIFECLDDESSGIECQLRAYCQFICDNWSKGRNDTDFVYPHVGDIFLLEEAAAAGCTMCAQFMQSASSAMVREAKEVMEQHCYAGLETGVSFSELNDMEESELLHLDLKFLLPLDSDDVFEDELDREIIILSVDMCATNFSGSTRNLDDGPTYKTKCALPLASRWLENCRKAHWQCNYRREQITPHRLVTTDQNCTRLRLREDFLDPPEYATLSHCWGEKKFVTLERHNLGNFKERIPQEALPQTFIDAILVARELGILYIWIDSLCIIQDDTDDWLREAATMSSVYGGSTLNIAASGAHDGAVGCFLRPQYTLQCLIQVEAGGRTLHYRCVPGNFYYHVLADMPLMRRGWTLQERLLPSRNLHFTSTQVFWECYQKVACETFPDKFPHSLTYEDSYLQKQPVSISMWSWIVERYSSCHLTRTEDKLVAISGLAREIQLQTRDQYVVGMWRKDLEFQLCWENMGGQKYQRITLQSADLVLGIS